MGQHAVSQVNRQIHIENKILQWSNRLLHGQHMFVNALIALPDSAKNAHASNEFPNSSTIDHSLSCRDHKSRADHICQEWSKLLICIAPFQELGCSTIAVLDFLVESLHCFALLKISRNQSEIISNLVDKSTKLSLSFEEFVPPPHGATLAQSQKGHHKDWVTEEKYYVQQPVYLCGLLHCQSPKHEQQANLLHYWKDHGESIKYQIWNVPSHRHCQVRIGYALTRWFTVIQKLAHQVCL
mmetsp:Transcript_54917/g.103136  ORF Transcript_54917/g.103136 Transcript_54917/m.103136 type:complete len:240 (-) Transcript_54917:76-795(-)